MNDVWEVIVVRHPYRGQTVKSVIDYDTYEEALNYAKVKRRYPCEVKIIHRYEVEEIVYEDVSV